MATLFDVGSGYKIEIVRGNKWVLWCAFCGRRETNLHNEPLPIRCRDCNQTGFDVWGIEVKLYAHYGDMSSDVSIVNGVISFMKAYVASDLKKRLPEQSREFLESSMQTREEENDYDETYILTPREIEKLVMTLFWENKASLPALVEALKEDRAEGEWNR